MKSLRPILVIGGAAFFVVLLVLLLINGESRDHANDRASTPTTTAPRPGYGPGGDVLNTGPETGGPEAVTLTNPNRIHRFLTDTSEQETRDLLIQLAKARMRHPKNIKIVGRAYPADDGTLPLQLRGGTPPRTLSIVVDTTKPGRLTIRVGGKTFKSVATDDQRPEPGGTPSQPNS